MGPVDMDACIGPYRLAHAHMNGDAPFRLITGLTHLAGVMPVITTTPDFRPVLWNMALPDREALRQQTKPRPRWRD